jgi:hypothetical protein
MGLVENEVHSPSFLEVPLSSREEISSRFTKVLKRRRELR